MANVCEAAAIVAPYHLAALVACPSTLPELTPTTQLPSCEKTNIPTSRWVTFSTEMKTHL